MVARCQSFAGTSAEIHMCKKQGETCVWQNSNDRFRPDFLSPTDLPRRYRLGECLGQGGAGAVYAAWDERLNRPVAIKQIFHPPDLDGLREAQITAGMRHPAFVAVFDAWREARHTFIVMERVPGMTLKAHLSQHGAASPEQACEWMLQLARAMAAAHAQGLVHGDLKPSNLMVQPDEGSTGSRQGAAFRLRVLDLGIARQFDPLATGTQPHGVSEAGTLAYMAPEQLRGEGPSVATDIYALGLVLLAALHGATPDFAASRLTLVWRRLHGDPGRSVEHRHWPPALSSMMAWLLAANPAQRPTDMTQVAEGLAHLLAMLRPSPSAAADPAGGAC